MNHTFEYETDESAKTFLSEGEVGNPPDTTPPLRALASLSSNIQNKNDDWTFDLDKTRRYIDSMRSKVKVKFSQKNKKNGR
jgi:hypothetical protein